MHFSSKRVGLQAYITSTDINLNRSHVTVAATLRHQNY